MPVDPSPAPQRELTVAHVRDRPDMDFVEVMFVESARIFRVSRSLARFDQLLSKLRQAEETGRVLKVTFTAPQGSEVGDVQDV